MERREHVQLEEPDRHHGRGAARGEGILRTTDQYELDLTDGDAPRHSRVFGRARLGRSLTGIGGRGYAA